jgi:hypothetical protein
MLELPSGRLLVYAGGMVVVIDTTLDRITDTVLVLRSAFSTASSPVLMRGRGDTTLVASPADLVFEVLDRDGHRIGRMPFPRPGDAQLSSLLGKPALDPSGRFVYQGRDSMPFGITWRSSGPPPSNHALLLRFDPARRLTDTLARLVRPAPGELVLMAPMPRVNRQVVAVRPIHDAWAVLTDGSVAIVRSSDYHIDWIRPDGRRESSPLLQPGRHPLTLAEKQRLIDDVHRSRVRVDSMWTRPFNPRPRGEASGTAQDVVYPTAQELPDFVGIFDPAHVIPDLTGRLWVRRIPDIEIAGTPPGSVYDLIDTRGIVVDRVRVPGGASVIGFGRGVVYLETTTLAEGTVIARVPIR